MDCELLPRDWGAVHRAYIESDPFNFAVIDNLVTQEACSRLRERLVSHWAWRPKTWMNDHLLNAQPDLPEIAVLAQGLRARLPQLLGKLDFVNHWAIMYTRNTPLDIHADDCALTVTFWLTADRYNEDPEGGGLILYDVKRPDHVLPYEHQVSQKVRDYLVAHSKGEERRVAHRCNRAVLLDARTFHRTDILKFVPLGPESFRMNLSLAFDDAVAYRRRGALYSEQAKAQAARGGKP